MKKFIQIFLAVSAFTLLVSKVAVAQEPILISPSVWVLGTNAVEDITVHIEGQEYVSENEVSINIYSAVDEEKLIEKIDEENIFTYTDNRGDLVIKFSPDMEKYDDGESYEVKIIVDGIDIDAVTISVKDVSKVLPVLEGGDKVRGGEGEGSVIQNCNVLELPELPDGEECPYGTYDPFEQ